MCGALAHGFRGSLFRTLATPGNLTPVSTQKLRSPLASTGRRVGIGLALMPGVPSLRYRPRRPDQGALHQIVREHYETFRAQVAEHRDGQGLPNFVERTFQDFLTCGPSTMLRAVPSKVDLTLPDGTTSSGSIRSALRLAGTRPLRLPRRAASTWRTRRVTSSRFKPAARLRSWQQIRCTTRHSPRRRSRPTRCLFAPRARSGHSPTARRRAERQCRPVPSGPPDAATGDRGVYVLTRVPMCTFQTVPPVCAGPGLIGARHGSHAGHQARPLRSRRPRRSRRDGQSRSRSCRPRSRVTPTGSRGSSAKPRSSPRSTTRTSPASLE